MPNIVDMIDNKIYGGIIASMYALSDAFITGKCQGRIYRGQRPAHAFTNKPVAIDPGNMDDRAHQDRPLQKHRANRLSDEDKIDLLESVIHLCVTGSEPQRGPACLLQVPERSM